MANLLRRLRRDLRGRRGHHHGGGNHHARHLADVYATRATRIEPLPTPQGVPASGTGMITLNMPIGEAYRCHGVIFKPGGTSFDPSNISAIRCKLNGKTFATLSGSQLDTINQYARRASFATGGVLPLWFTRDYLADTAQRYSTCINTTREHTRQARNGVRSFTIEMDVAGATAPTLTAEGVFSHAHPAQSQFLLRYDSWDEHVTAAGDYEWRGQQLYGMDDRKFLNRLYMFDTKANTTDIDFEDQDRTIYDTSTATNEALQDASPNVSPQAGLVVLDYVLDGDAARPYPVGDSQYMKLTTTHAAAIDPLPVLMETLGHTT